MTKIIQKMPLKRKPIYRKGHSVWQTYNGQIAVMRKSGMTLREIGDEVGVTRERIRQLLNKYYDGVDISYLREYQVAELIGCSDTTLGRLRQDGIVNPKKYGAKFWLYDRDEVEKAMLAVQKFCADCGEAIPFNRPKYCAECSAERQRYNYPFRSPEDKIRHIERAKKWQLKHPERYRVILKKAQQKYHAKRKEQHFNQTKYIVTRVGYLPVGTIFKAVRGERGRLVLEDGSKIPFGCVKILSE